MIMFSTLACLPACNRTPLASYMTCMQADHVCFTDSRSNNNRKSNQKHLEARHESIERHGDTYDEGKHQRDGKHGIVGSCEHAITGFSKSFTQVAPQLAKRCRLHSLGGQDLQPADTFLLVWRTASLNLTLQYTNRSC